MLDAHGNLKGLSQDMAVLYKHIEEHSKGGSDQNGFFKSIFGTTGMNGAMILAKSSKEVEDLTRRTEKAGKTGKYVSELAAKNMGTAQGSANSARQAMNAFKMTLGNAVLPAINEASNSLAKFLLSKDGEKFQKNVGKVVGDFANGLVSLIRFATQHETMMKFVGGGFLAGYATVKAAKAVSFVGGLYEQYKKLADISPRVASIGKTAGELTSTKTSFKNMTKGAKFAVGVSAVFNAAQIGNDFYQAATAKTAKQRIQSAGAGIGGLVGAGIGGMLGGAAGATIGAQLGQAMGPKAATEFVKYFNPDTKYVERHKGKDGKTHKRVFTANTGRTKAEKSWNMNHTMDWQNFLHPNNVADFFGGVANITWNWLGHLNDQGFKNRSAKTLKASYKGSWEESFGKWLHQPMGKVSPSIRENAKRANKNRSAIGNWWNSLFGGDKVQAAELTKAQRKALRNGKTIGVSATKGAKSGMKDFPSWTKQLSAKSNKWFKSKWDGMKSWAGGVNKNVQSGWHGFTSWSGNLSHRSSKFFKSKWSGMQSWAGGINKDVQSGWKGIKTWFGNLGKNAVDLFKKPFEGLSKWVSDHTPKPVKAALGAVGKGVNWVKGKLTGKAHANGGLMHTSHGALVGEAGPELVYKPYANNVRLLGANGPQFTKVHAGEHILNARDTAKVLNGGLGNGLTLKGYASGTDKLGKTSKKVTNDYKQIADKSFKSLNSLSKKSSSTWNKITRQTGKDSSKTRKRAISDYSDMHKGIVKQMDKTHDGVISLSESTAKGFGKALDKTKGYARDAMSDSIGEINKGITGIDKVLGQFGGNTSVIKPVKFATGTDANGRLTENTLAMVNDAQTGPRQEALVSDKNELFLPRGNNVTMMLPKGWGVLNGTQTQQVAKSAGVKHFAKGSGLSHSALRKLAEKAGANPAQSFKEMYLDKLKPSGSNLKRGSIGLAQNSSQHFGNPWSNAMWTVINDAIGDSSKNAKGLLKAVEKNGEGHKYVWGAAGPSAFDCSGLVMYTLKHDYGIDYPHFSGAQYARTQHISKNDARMGDLVFWGPGDHVGVYAGGNKYFSAESPSQGIHMNTLSSVVGHGSPMFGRVKGIKNDFSKATRKNTADKALINLAKRELGASALKWIKDKLGDEMGSLSNPSGDGVARWRSVIERAARVMHVSLSKADLAHILNVTAHESGGNPKAVNGWDSNAKAGTPSKGVIQFIQPTFDHYAVKGHHNILNGYDQYLAMFNDKTWRRDLTLGGWGPTGAVRGYAKGGRPKAHTPFIAGERGPELITADGPVKVDSHEQTKRKVSDLAQMFKFPKINRPTRSNSSAPVININLNGPIYGTREDAKRIAELVRREINKVLVNIGDEFGTDPSLY